MFDPNVSDPLVIEHGADTYGVIAPMDMIISCAMYHDIVAMNRKKNKYVLPFIVISDRKRGGGELLCGDNSYVLN